MLGKPKGPPRASLAPHPADWRCLLPCSRCPSLSQEGPLVGVWMWKLCFPESQVCLPRFSLHSLFCPITEGQMCCSMVRAEERGSRLPSTDLPSHHSISLPRRVIVRKTHTELQQHLGSCCRTHPCTIVFYNLDFAAGPKLGGKEAL